MLEKNLLETAIKFHGHKCPAMPLGLRAGLAAMKKLEVERASNKELYCRLETGPAHAMKCFGDGVMVATGCTYGKGNIEEINHSKTAITLINVKTKKAVRVIVKPEFQKKGLNSEFIKMRKKGVEPKYVPIEIIDPIVENIMNQPDEVLFNISEVFDFGFEPKKSTFEWYECDGCGEVVFAHGIRIKDGKKLCISCV